MPTCEQVALLAPTTADAGIAAAVLGQWGIQTVAFGTFDELCIAIEKGVGVAMLVEEALTRENHERLAALLAAEPPWSSTPFVVLTRARSATSHAGSPPHPLSSALLVERPVRIENLMSAIRSSLDSRRRQYAMRDLLEESRRSADERAQLLVAAEQSRQQAETANRMKDEFLAVLSHELRTPLNAIVGWVALLRRGSLNADQVIRALESIERNSRLQTQLIDDLLDMSRVISGSLRLDVQPLELDAVVAEAISTVTPLSVAKGVQIVTAGDKRTTLVRGDPARVQQIIWNLLSNAIKFTPSGGTVAVSVEHSGSMAEVRVSDTGEGIAPEFLPHVFERFRQADSSTTRQRGGLGLGLAIVRQLVELHGGSIAASSAGHGLGATFLVRLPLVNSSAAINTNLPSPTQRSSAADHRSLALFGRTVLVIDDDAETLQMLEAALAANGAQVFTAASVANGLELARRVAPSVILSDISMPGEDGFSFVRKLRAASVGAEIPAIALTAHAREEDKRAMLSAGFQLHLAKPVDPTELVRTVAELADGPGR